MLFRPILPLSDKEKDLITFCIRLSAKSPTGFIALYEENLLLHKKPGVAYEATEQTYVGLFGRRRFKDREHFYNVKSWSARQKRKKSGDNPANE